MKIVLENGDTSTTVGDAIFRINAGNEKLFPWGSGIAHKYQLYKLIGCVLQFESLVNTNATTTTAFLPELVMNSHDNPHLNNPSTAQQMKIQPLCAAGRIDRNITCGVECHPARIANNGWQYVVPMSPYEVIDSTVRKTITADVNETDLGKVYCYIDAMNSAFSDKQVGKLWVTYKFALTRTLYKSQRKSGTEAAALDPLVDAAHRDVVSSVAAVVQRGAQALSEDEMDELHNEPHAANNAGHADYNPQELFQFKNYTNNGWYNILTWNTAQYLDAPYNWGRVHTATNGIPTGIARFVSIEVKSRTSADVPSTDDTYFLQGSVIPHVSESYKLKQNPGTKISTHVIDNMGWKPVIGDTGHTRFYLLRRPRANAVFKITVEWSGLIEQENVNNNIVAATTSRSSTSMLVVARRPRVFISSVRHFQRVNGSCLDYLRGDDQFVGESEASLLTKVITKGDGADYSSDVSALYNFLDIAGLSKGAHTDWPTCSQTHRYMEQFFVIANNAVTTDTTLPYFDISPITSYRNVLLTGSSNTNVPASSFNNSWAPDTTTAPKNVAHDVTDIRYGSRSVTIEETTYHALPPYFLTEKMYDRDTKYTQQQADANAHQLKAEKEEVFNYSGFPIFSGNR